jgi:hypothetical protein
LRSRESDKKGRVMRRTTTFLGSLLLLPVFTLLPATQADATVRNFVCEIGEFCVYTDLSWGTNGDWKDLPNAVSDWNNGDYRITDRDSSWRNKYSQAIIAYKNYSYGGGIEVCLAPGIAHSAGAFSPWDDDGRSNHNVSAC